MTRAAADLDGSRLGVARTGRGPYSANRRGIVLCVDCAPLRDDGLGPSHATLHRPPWTPLDHLDIWNIFSKKSILRPRTSRKRCSSKNDADCPNGCPKILILEPKSAPQHVWSLWSQFGPRSVSNVFPRPCRRLDGWDTYLSVMITDDH